MEGTIGVVEPGVNETGKPQEVPRWKKAAKALWKGAKAFVFVVTAFAFWYLFASLAKTVMRCELTSWWPPESQCQEMQLGTLTDPSWGYVTILLATLVVAIWAARRLVFPPDD